MREVEGSVKKIPNIVIENNKTQPVFDYKECIFEKVFVETPVDTDKDGKLDLIAVYIRRPKETLEGMKVPAIYVADPYMMLCNEDWYKPHNVDKDLVIFEEQNIARDEITYDFSQGIERPDIVKRESLGIAETSIVEEIHLDCITDWYSYFNSRGYASVFCAGLGTKGSEGFNNCGSVEETAAFAAVIDWLNGRCRAFTNRTDNIEIKAGWSTGNVAMSGKSYLGTMCIAVAMTGIDGLKTVVPEAAISNWYEYYRYNGLNLPAIGWQGDDLDILAKYCFSRAMDSDYPEIKASYFKWLEGIEKAEDRESGNYNLFWDERNYLNQVSNMKASAFIVHGINDWNVKMNQCDLFWRALEKHDVPRKMMLHQGEHIYIHNLENSNFNDILHGWMDYWLYGIENDVMNKVPNVMIENNLRQDEWMPSKCWPAEGSAYSSLSLEKSVDVSEFVDDLAATVYDREKDNLEEWLREQVLFEGKQTKNSIPLMSEKLKTETRISGSVKVSFKAAIDKPTAILSAMLVDYGDDKRLLPSQEVALKEGITWGKNTPAADLMRFKTEEEPSKFRVISRSWLNAQNRENIWSKKQVVSGEYYQYNLSMIPTDYTVKAGHSIGVILYGTDPQATQRPFVATKVSVDMNSLKVDVPFVK